MGRSRSNVAIPCGSPQTKNQLNQFRYLDMTHQHYTQTDKYAEKTWLYPHWLLSAGTCHMAPANVDRYLMSAGSSAANPPAAVAAVDLWLWQKMDGRTPNSYIDHALCKMRLASKTHNPHSKPNHYHSQLKNLENKQWHITYIFSRWWYRRPCSCCSCWFIQLHLFFPSITAHQRNINLITNIHPKCLMASSTFTWVNLPGH